MEDVLEQKLEKFNDSVNTEVEEHISEIMNKANEKSKEELEKAETDALFDAYTRIQKAVRETEAKYRKMYALEEQNFRMDSLRHRDSLSQKIFSDVEKRLFEFAESEKYCDYLMNITADEKLSDEAVAAVAPKDEKYGKRLKEKYGCEVMADASIEIGGIMFIDSKQGLIIDKTFDSALEEQKKAFSSRYSFKVES